MAAKKKLLIADDNMDIRQMLRMQLEDTFEIVEASDGDAALETLIVEQPDLVLLDVMMPGLNGWEICQYVRKKKDLERTGVVILSGIGPKVNEMTAGLYGADAFFDKQAVLPLDEIQSTLLNVLKKRQG